MIECWKDKAFEEMDKHLEQTTVHLELSFPDREVAAMFFLEFSTTHTLGTELPSGQPKWYTFNVDQLIGGSTDDD